MPLSYMPVCLYGSTSLAMWLGRRASLNQDTWVPNPISLDDLILDYFSREHENNTYLKGRMQNGPLICSMKLSLSIELG